MDRWLVPVIAAVVALAVGFAIGAAVYADDDPASTATGPDVVATPDETAPAGLDEASRQTCLAALDGAQEDVQAEQRLSGVLNDYESVIERATDALSDFDTRRLEQLLSEIEELNRRSQRLINDTRQADVTGAIETCRSVLGVNDI